MVITREVPAKSQIHSEIRLHTPSILDECTPSRLKLVEVVAAHLGAVLSVVLSYGKPAPPGLTPLILPRKTAYRSSALTYRSSRRWGSGS